MTRHVLSCLAMARYGGIVKPPHFSDLRIYRDRGGEVLFDAAALYGHENAIEAPSLTPTGRSAIGEREAGATKTVGYIVNRKAVFGPILRGSGVVVLMWLHMSLR